MVSLVSGGLAAWVVFRVAAWLTGRRTARRATLLFCFFPGSVVFSLVYAEGLMIALAGACLLALERRRWVVAGLMAALAGVTRPNAVVLVAVCAWVAAEAVRQHREFGALAAPALAAAGSVGFLGYLGWRTGEAGAWFRVEHEGWHQRMDAGRALLDTMTWALKDPLGRLEPLIVTAMFAMAVAGLWTLVRRRRSWPVAVHLYATAALGLAAVSHLDVLRPRAVLAAFPIFIGVGDHLSRRAFTVLLTLFGVALAVLPWYWSLPFLSSSSP
jgi:hypothetical protein